jgi:hypothetical protein
MRELIPLSEDMLWGVKQIARFLGCTEKAISNMHLRGKLPTFKHGGRVCARRSTLLADIEKREHSHGRD